MKRYLVLVMFLLVCLGRPFAQVVDGQVRDDWSCSLMAEAVEYELGFSAENAGLDVQGLCACVSQHWDSVKWSVSLLDERRLEVPPQCLWNWPEVVVDHWRALPFGPSLFLGWMLDGAQGEELSAGRAARQWMLEMEGVEFTDLDAVCTCMAQKLVANGSYNAGLIDFETFWDVAVSCGAQLPQPEQKKAWLAVVTSPVNCRQGPGIEYDVIGIYPDSTQLIVESLGDTDGFYPAFDLNQGLKGWVHRDYVEILQEISYQTDGVLNSVGDVLSDNAWVQVKNDAGCSISVRFDQGPSDEFVKL